MLRKAGVVLLFVNIVWGAVIFDGITGKQMVKIVKDAGYKAKLTKDSSGDPKIETKVNGLNSSIYFYGCHGPEGEKECTAIQYYAGFDKDYTLKQANKWNTKKRYGRSYVRNGHARIEYDVAVNGGVTKEYLANTIDRWESVLSSFTKFIDW